MAHRARVLRNPIFLGALALLLLNDHIFKGAGVLPGWLTGKLSDFAGLIVAPVLFAVLVQARSRVACAMAIGTVAIGFSVLELSTSAAAYYDAMLGTLGIPSRSWADPTDLIALAVLPITWWVIETEGPRLGERGLVWVWQQVLLGVALFACIATTVPRPIGWVTDAWIHNVTNETVDVRIQWVSGPRDCTLLSNEELPLDAAVDPELFTEGVTFRLEPGAMVPIDPNNAWMAAGGDLTNRPLGGDDACQIARISMDGAPETIAFWLRDATMELASHEELHEDSPIDEREIVIAGERSVFRLVPGNNYRTSPVRDLGPVVPPHCTEARGIPMAHSDLGDTSEITATVESRALLPDGCTDLGITVDGAFVIESFFVCAPEDFIPFVPGDRIRIRDDGHGKIEIWTRDPDTGALVFPKLVLLHGVPTIAEDGFAVDPSAPDIECAERLPCGAYVAPLVVDDSGAIELDRVIQSTSIGEHPLRVLVTRAEHVVIGHDACDAGRDRSGTMIDAVMLYESLPESETHDEEEP